MKYDDAKDYCLERVSLLRVVIDVKKIFKHPHSILIDQLTK